MIGTGRVPRDGARRVDFRAVAGPRDRPVGIARGGVSMITARSARL